MDLMWSDSDSPLALWRDRGTGVLADSLSAGFSEDTTTTLPGLRRLVPH
jgi:hypothetical protein